MKFVTPTGFISFAVEWNKLIIVCSSYTIIVLNEYKQVINTFPLEKGFWNGGYLCSDDKAFFFYCSDSYIDNDNFQTWDPWIYKISYKGLISKKLSCELFSKIVGLGIHLLAAQIHKGLLYISGVIQSHRSDERAGTKYENKIGYAIIDPSKTDKIELVALPNEGSAFMHDMCLTVDDERLIIAFSKYSKSIVYIVDIDLRTKEYRRIEFDSKIDSRHHIQKMFQFRVGGIWTIFLDIKSENSLKKYKFHIHRIDIHINEQISTQHHILDEAQFVVNPTFSLIDNALYAAYTGKVPVDAIICSRIENSVETVVQKIEENVIPILITKDGLFAWNDKPYGIYFENINWK